MKFYYFIVLLLLPVFIFGEDGPVVQEYSPGNFYKAIALADYNGDGVVDVWSANSTNNHVEIRSYSQEKDSLVMVAEIADDGLPTPDAHIHDIAVADLDKDGDMDAVLTFRWNGTYICMNEGDSTWSISHLDGTYGWQVVIGDFDNDTNPDIMLATDWIYLKIYYGDGSGQFTAGAAPSSAFSNGDSKGMNAVDVDGDGDLDLMGLAGEWTQSSTNRYYLRVYKNELNETDTTWSSSIGPQDSLTLYPNWVQSSNNSAGDLNGDGYMDQVCFTYDNNIIIFYGGSDENGLFWTADTLLKNYADPFSSVTMLDLNGDSKLDILATGYDHFDGLIFFANEGNGQFDSNYVELGNGFGDFHSVKSGDIDGNGTVDLVGSKYNFETHSNDGFQIYLFPKEKSDSIIYVDQSATGKENGTSWQDAYRSLQDALNNAADGAQVWVAKGTYYPVYFEDQRGVDPRTYSFEIPKNVSLYGGFSGTEMSPQERTFQDTTILSGDIDNPDDPGDNSYHVVTTDGNNRIDGFVIGEGNANSDSPYDMGAGIYNLSDSITVTNCTFRDNYAVQGAGMANSRIGAFTHYIEIKNCTFSHNRAENGAGIGNWDCPTYIERCLFVADSVTNMGGAVFNWGALSNADIIHCTFYANAAGDSSLGGAVHSRASGIYTNLINCILWNNSSDIGYGSETHGAVTHVYYSDLQDTTIQGSNNIFEDPLFADPASFDFSLSQGSPCIDAGTDLLIVDTDTLYQSDSTSYKGAAPDMGAFESENSTALARTEQGIPADFELMQNYPNPFNPTTTIRYRLSQKGHVNLTVYDIQGRKVKTLVNGQQTAGTYSVRFNGVKLASGIYLYKIATGRFTKIKKMILVR